MNNKMKVIGNIYCAGVYGMRCKSSEEDYLYVGSSIECNDAMSRHLYFLKRGLYEDTNKAILQKEYDNNNLVFEVIKTSCFDKVNEMGIKQKDNLQKELSVLEKFYIDLYKKTVCNKQKSVTKHSSNKNTITRYKRRQSNTGSKNPNNKYNEKIIAEILWLKINGYKAKEIEQIYKAVGIKANYITCIGLTKWIHLEPRKPSFIGNKAI